MRFEQRDRRVDQLLPCSLALGAQLAAVGFGRILIRQRRFVPQNPVLPLFFSVHPNSRLAIWQKIDVSSKITRNRRKLGIRSEEHTSELQSLMRISYAVFFLNKNIT